MNKSFLIGLGVLVAAGVGIGLVFGNPLNLINQGQRPAMFGGSGNQSLSMSMVDLIRLGKNYSCTFTTVQEDGTTTNGKMHIAQSGEKLRGEFEIIEVDGVMTKAYMIRDGEYHYMWGSEEPDGFKMRILAEDDGLFYDSDDDEIDGDSSQFDFDENQEVEFDCQSWRVDESYFVPPTDVTFIDFSEQIIQLQESYGTGSNLEANFGSSNGADMYDSDDYCVACEQIEDAGARAQCMSAMGC